MKKFLVMIFAITLGLISCKTSLDNKGCLVVSNYSEKPKLEIVGVYAKEEGSSGYNLVFSGVIENSKSHFIDLYPGSYSIKVAVRNCSLGGCITYYDTGYNIYKQTKSQSLISVIFDGNGIYFE